MLNTFIGKKQGPLEKNARQIQTGGKPVALKILILAEMEPQASAKGCFLPPYTNDNTLPISDYTGKDIWILSGPCLDKRWNKDGAPAGNSSHNLCPVGT